MFVQQMVKTKRRKEERNVVMDGENKVSDVMERRTYTASFPENT